MEVYDGRSGDKKHYTTPKLVIHGTLKDITLLRFNWQGRREWGEGSVDNIS